MEERKVIDFKFKWEGKNFDKIAPNVLTIAKKLLELNLVMVEEDLNEEGCIVIRHRGVCRKRGLVECINTGIVEDKEFYYTYVIIPVRVIPVEKKLGNIIIKRLYYFNIYIIRGKKGTYLLIPPLSV